MNNLNETQNLNYEQKKNNGKGVFYGVIAVATLIVAIIGATFAYFTASSNSSDEALKATAAHVEVNYLEGRQLVATNLIPSSAKVVADAYARDTAYEKNVANGCVHKTDKDSKEANPESMTVATNWDCTGAMKVTSGFTDNERTFTENQIINADVYASLSETNKANCTAANTSAVSTGDVGTKCVDDNGYYVCAVYEFTVTNTSNVKQSLQSYMTINSNGFTTVDNAAATAQQALDEHHTNGALKFMTVRSKSLIDVTAIEEGDGCSNSLTFSPTQTVKSKMFCNAKGGADVFDANTVDHNVPSGESPVVGRFSDTSGYYYYFNTTAVRQSLRNEGENQNVFSGEILPSIDSSRLTSSNGILYMHTIKQADTDNITKVGPADRQTDVTTIYADSNGYVYDSLDDCNAGKTFNATCQQVYLSSSSTSSGCTGEDPNKVCDVVVGAYGQVSRTYYIVAWLEENNPDNLLNFYGSDAENEYTGALTKKAKDRGRTTNDKLDQDDDQDASFATTIYVTSGAADGSKVPGITGQIK